jgi:hypothetical protein
VSGCLTICVKGTLLCIAVGTFNFVASAICFKLSFIYFFKLELFKELVFCAIIDPFIMDNIEYM